MEALWGELNTEYLMFLVAWTIYYGSENRTVKSNWWLMNGSNQEINLILEIRPGTIIWPRDVLNIPLTIYKVNLSKWITPSLPTRTLAEYISMQSSLK